MDAASSSETSTNLDQTLGRHIQEDSNLHSHGRKYLKSHKGYPTQHPFHKHPPSVILFIRLTVQVTNPPKKFSSAYCNVFRYSRQEEEIYIFF
jgi:hypothetical protein